MAKQENKTTKKPLIERYAEWLADYGNKSIWHTLGAAATVPWVMIFLIISYPVRWLVTKCSAK